MSDRGQVVHELLLHVRPIVLHSARLVEAGVRELGWTIGSRAVVEVLAAGGPLTVPQVARRLSLARQNVQRYVDELIDLGHASTAPNPAHRRSVLVNLTDAGESAYQRMHSDELRRMARLATQMTDEELAVAERVLSALDEDIRLAAERIAKR